jgi:hypothetical protein
MEQMLQISCCCYQKALALEPHDQQKNNIQRRLGNIHNELGVLYMNLAAGIVILSNVMEAESNLNFSGERAV